MLHVLRSILSRPCRNKQEEALKMAMASGLGYMLLLSLSKLDLSGLFLLEPRNTQSNMAQAKGKSSCCLLRGVGGSEVGAHALRVWRMCKSK